MSEPTERTNTDRTPPEPRDYSPLASLLPAHHRFATMQLVVDALWKHFGGEHRGKRQMSWLGFYFGPGAVAPDPDAASDARATPTNRGSSAGPLHRAPTVVVPDAHMVLGPCRDKPACSPIGMHGACGRASLRRETLLVHDIERLGAGYIACDPRDRSELVVPLTEPGGRVYGVFDADSFDTNAFDEHDAEQLHRLLTTLGLTTLPPPKVVVV